MPALTDAPTVLLCPELSECELEVPVASLVLVLVPVLLLSVWPVLVPELTPKLLPVDCADPEESVCDWLVLVPLDTPSDVLQLAPSL